MLQELNYSEHVPKYIEFIDRPDILYHVLELSNGGNLAEFLERAGGKLPEH